MRRPSPGIEKTVSTTTDPDRRRLVLIPRTVITGIVALPNACLPTTTHVDSPLARAVRT